jgi:hypothetical protein
MLEHTRTASSSCEEFMKVDIKFAVQGSNSCLGSSCCVASRVSGLHAAVALQIFIFEIVIVKLSLPSRRIGLFCLGACNLLKYSCQVLLLLQLVYPAGAAVGQYVAVTIPVLQQLNIHMTGFLRVTRPLCSLTTSVTTSEQAHVPRGQACLHDYAMSSSSFWLWADSYH